MKLIALIALFIVGVTSEKPEVTSASSASSPLTTNANERISTSLKTNHDAGSTSNRRDGISYSTSVIHRNPDHPEQEAASSIDFRLNTDAKPSQHQHLHDVHSPSGYSKPNDYHSHSGSASGSGSGEYSSQGPELVAHVAHDFHGSRETVTDDVIYGKNTGQATSTFQFEQGHQGLQPVAQRGHGHDSPGHHSQHVNHQQFYKQMYAQPVFTETKHKIEVAHPTTQFKHSSNGGSGSGRVLSTPRPRTTPQVFRTGPPRTNHASHGSHSHQTHHKLPVPQAFTQVIYNNPESTKSGKAISFTHQNQNHQNHQNQNHNDQTQSFNVGYSVKFGNDQSQAGQRKKPYKPTRPESDIITGSHKEEVSKPTHLSHLAHHRFPSSSASSQQDDKAFFSASNNNPQQILSQANLTPKTQKQLAFLENIQSHKFVQKEPLQSNFPWKNLSPSVEIYRSKEISLPSGTVTKSYGFDHDKAIGKSEGFDYTNAVDYNGNVVKTLSSQPQGLALQIPALQGHETQQVQVQAQLELQPQLSSESQTYQYLPIPDSGAQGSSVDKIPPLPKLPIDTSLIREPFLTVHKDRMQSHGAGAQLPIHFDTTLIKDMGNAYGQIFNEGPAPQFSSGSTYQDNLAQINNLLAEQSQQHHNYQQLVPSANPPQLEATDQNNPGYQEPPKPNIILLQQAPNRHQDDMTFSYPQNGLFNPIMAMVPKPTESAQMPVLFTPQGSIKAIDPQLLKHLKMYKVKEHVPDHVQPQLVKFKVFGKPGNAFMRHQYEKMRHVVPIRMQGAQIQSSPSSKRLVRDYTNIEMDLRPPPMAVPFKTANFIRIKQ